MAQLIDQYGRPVQRKVLTQELAKPGVTGIRQAISPSAATGLTPARLATMLREGAEGGLQDYLALAEEMEERDAHYASVLGIRKRAVSGITPTVIPAGDDARSQEIADAVRRDIAEHSRWADLVETMLDALGKGFAVTEIIWDKSGTRWRPADFAWTDPRFFTLDRDTLSELHLLTDQEPIYGEPLDPFKWIVHRASIKSGLIARGGLARLVAFGWICKAYTVKDWMAFVETYGLPLRIGRYGPEATKDDVNTLFRAVANIGTDAAAVLPKSMNIDFEKAAEGGSGNTIFESLARWVDEQTSKAVLGQTMTSDNGSSQSQAEVHNEVRHDIIAADARSLTGTVQRDLVVPYVDLNFGKQTAYPHIVVSVREPEDVKLIMDSTAALMAGGLKVKASEVRGKLGYSDPDADDEVIGGAMAPAVPVVVGEAANRAQPGDAASDPYAPLDEIEARELRDWEEIMDPVLNPVRAILEEATSIEDAIARLPDALSQMDERRLIEGLMRASFIARARGDASDE